MSAEHLENNLILPASEYLGSERRSTGQALEETGDRPAQPSPLQMGRRVKCFPLSYAMEGPRQARRVAAWLREPGLTLAYLRLRSCSYHLLLPQLLD